jgi:hypothetical protein
MLFENPKIKIIGITYQNKHGSKYYSKYYTDKNNQKNHFIDFNIS